MTTPMQAANAHVLAQKISVVHIGKIEPHPANVREDLGDLAEMAASIRKHGILQPLIVQPHPSKNGCYRVLAGHRRLGGAKRAGLTAVPVVVRHGVDEDGVLELMLVENCQRRDLNPVERAEAYGALVNRGYTQTQIAKQTGVSFSTVSYFMALLDLDAATRDKVRSRNLSVQSAVNAVRRSRRAERKKRGSTADYSWEPDHLADTHPLAKKARRLCDAREHSMRRRIGDTACGQCWETVIRQDEQVVIQASQDDP